MSYEEWKEEYSKGKFRVKERDLEVAWNAAIDEAVEVVSIKNYRGEILYPNMLLRLKELKNDS